MGIKLWSHEVMKVLQYFRTTQTRAKDVKKFKQSETVRSSRMLNTLKGYSYSMELFFLVLIPLSFLFSHLFPLICVFYQGRDCAYLMFSSIPNTSTIMGHVAYAQ
jgi:hypothetical protein